MGRRAPRVSWLVLLAVALAATPDAAADAAWRAQIDAGELDAALRTVQDWLAAAEGPEERALMLRQQAAVLQRLGRSEHARAVLEQAAAELVGSDAVTLHQSLWMRLGLLAYEEGDLQRALEAFQQVLALEGEVETREAARLNLALVQSEAGQLDLAQASLEVLERGQRQRLGPDHPDTLYTMVNRAGVLYEAGRRIAAEQLSQEAVRRTRAALGPDSELYGMALYNHAVAVDPDAGGSEQARREMSEVLALREASDGPEALSVVEPLYALAVIARQRGDAPGAVLLLERARAVMSNYPGQLGRLEDWVLTELAWCHFSMDDEELALEVVSRAIASTEAALGPQHPFLISRLALRSAVLLAVGESQLALADLRRAVALGERYWSEQDPELAGMRGQFALAQALSGVAVDLQAQRERIETLAALPGVEAALLVEQHRGLALMQWLQGEDDAAIATLDVAISLAEDRLSALAGDTAARERREALAAQRNLVDRALMLRLGRQPSVGDAAMLMRWKAAARRVQQPAPSPLTARLDAVRSDIAALTLELDVDEDDRRSRLLELSRQKESLERDLDGQDPFAALPSVEEVCRALPEGAALVDLHSYWGAAAGFSDTSLRSARRYLAVVLRAGQCDAVPGRVDLGSASVLESQLRQVQARWQHGDDAIGASRALTAALWTPLGLDAQALQTLVVVPDGRLAAASFAGLLLEDGSRLVEHAAVVVLSDATELTRTVPAWPPQGRAVVVGGVDTAEVVRSPCGLEALPPLPGAAEEAAWVGRWARRRGHRVRSLTGTDATEAAVAMQSTGATLVHLAAHGFLASEQCLPALEPAAATWGASGLSVLALNPLTLSGIVLAPDDGHDGVWTAEEVSSLQLAPGALVVLSACQSGLGQLADGAGVLGLGRAFANAGAGELVMSLWSVPDAATSQLMTDFYRGLRRGQGAAEALRQAQVRGLRRARRSGLDDPGAWAAFIVSGWRR